MCVRVRMRSVEEFSATEFLQQSVYGLGQTQGWETAAILTCDQDTRYWFFKLMFPFNRLPHLFQNGRSWVISSRLLLTQSPPFVCCLGIGVHQSLSIFAGPMHALLV